MELKERVRRLIEENRLSEFLLRHGFYALKSRSFWKALVELYDELPPLSREIIYKMFLLSPNARFKEVEEFFLRALSSEEEEALELVVLCCSLVPSREICVKVADLVGRVGNAEISLDFLAKHLTAEDAEAIANRFLSKSTEGLKAIRSVLKRTNDAIKRRTITLLLERAEESLNDPPEYLKVMESLGALSEVVKEADEEVKVQTLNALTEGLNSDNEEIALGTSRILLTSLEWIFSRLDARLKERLITTALNNATSNAAYWSWIALAFKYLNPQIPEVELLEEAVARVIELSTENPYLTEEFRSSLLASLARANGERFRDLTEELQRSLIEVIFKDLENAIFFYFPEEDPIPDEHRLNWRVVWRFIREDLKEEAIQKLIKAADGGNERECLKSTLTIANLLILDFPLDGLPYGRETLLQQIEKRIRSQEHKCAYYAGYLSELLKSRGLKGAEEGNPSEVLRVLFRKVQKLEKPGSNGVNEDLILIPKLVKWKIAETGDESAALAFLKSGIRVLNRKDLDAQVYTDILEAIEELSGIIKNFSTEVKEELILAILKLLKEGDSWVRNAIRTLRILAPVMEGVNLALQKRVVEFLIEKLKVDCVLTRIEATLALSEISRSITRSNPALGIIAQRIAIRTLLKEILEVEPYEYTDAFLEAIRSHYEDDTGRELTVNLINRLTFNGVWPESAVLLERTLQHKYRRRFNLNPNYLLLLLSEGVSHAEWMIISPGEEKKAAIEAIKAAYGFALRNQATDLPLKASEASKRLKSIQLSLERDETCLKEDGA